MKCIGRFKYLYDLNIFSFVLFFLQESYSKSFLITIQMSKDFENRDFHETDLHYFLYSRRKNFQTYWEIFWYQYRWCKKSSRWCQSEKIALRTIVFELQSSIVIDFEIFKLESLFDNSKIADHLRSIKV